MNIEYGIGRKTHVVSGAGDSWFLLTNPRGDYASFPSVEASKYHGWVVRENGGYVKVLDALEAARGGTRPFRMRYGENDARRIFPGFEEQVWLDSAGRGLRLRYSKPVTRIPWFDIRPLLAFPEWNRAHECVRRDGRRAVVKARVEGVSLYVAVAADGRVGEWRERWELRRYPYDALRGSHPNERFAWSPFELSGTRFSFGAAETPDEAFRIAERGMRQSAPQKCFSVIPALPIEKRRSAPRAIRAAACAARHSLSGLFIKKEAALRAGLPWFGVPWPRDALIASRAFPLRHRRAILAPFFVRAGSDGALPVFPGAASKSADGLVWLFLAAAELPAGQRAVLERETKKTLRALIGHFEADKMRGGLVINEPRETWMDSVDRGGARIELQAFILRTYALLARSTRDAAWRARELSMRERVRRAFWDGTTLADGVEDTTIRANLFFALYLYPELLAPDEWRRCLASALRALWLPWGGISTLDARDPRFYPVSTGEDPASYHQGDSWFYLNNLAALAMHRLHARRYAPYVQRILAASTRDILTAQAIGCASEISSAERFAPAGSWSQAWSASTYLELAGAYYGRATRV